jgi:citrate lyase subunit beta/citryl-CoA lyase
VTAPDKRARVANSLSALFVPGDRPERFQKAYKSGAHVVIIDLEDAVAPENKTEALTSVLSHLSNNSDAEKLEALVRINKERVSTELPALVDLAKTPGNGLLGVVFPKVSSRVDIPGNLGDMAVVALIESAAGIENVSSIARATGLTRLAFGAVDFGAEMESQHPTLLGYARSRIVIASAAAGLARPLDSPSVEITNEDKILEDCADGYKLGFGGKLSIHPSQLAAIHASFAPSAEEVEWAKKILQATEAASQMDGQMIDRPVSEKARKILQRASADS